MIENWSIKRKLTFIVMTTSCAAIAISMLGFLAYDLVQYRRAISRDLLMEARLIAESSGAAVILNDQPAARRILAALGVREEVVSAVIYNESNRLIASYGNKEERSSSTAILRAESPIMVDGKRVGRIAIESDGRYFGQRLASFLAIAPCLSLFAAAVAYLLSSRLRRLITDPVESLTTNLVALNEGLERRVTERSRAAEERAQALVESEHRLRQAKERAEQASRTKNVFLANVSHELRTPLNAIIGYSEMLEDEFEELGRHDQSSDLGRIRNAGKHLLSIINDILDLSKIEAGRIEVYAEEFDLYAVINAAVITTKPLADKNSNMISVSDPEHIRMNTDQTKVRQVITNLLGNACKLAASGSIRVSTKVETDTDCVLIMVQDSGIKVQREQEERLFEPFVQADASPTRKFGGTALGLSISRKFCRLLGGDLTLDSSAERGSAFVARIPIHYLPIQQSEIKELACA